MSTTNKEKLPPKTEIKFSITLSDEQKQAKSTVMQTPFNFILGKAGSGKTLLAVQIGTVVSTYSQ
jgi:predicted ribonuclease YlaK